MNDDYLALDAIGQAELIKKGEISATELMDATIRRIEQLNSKLNFLASANFDQASSAAKSGAYSRNGLFSGVGLLLKDVIEYPGLPTMYGSRLFASHLSTIETPYARSLAEAGFIPLGKTTTSEFSLIGSTEAIVYGPTLNAWNTEYSAGGSSGGAAVAVACRAVPLAHGSDGGGSIRIPASINGVFGLKPSAGRTPRQYPTLNDLTSLVSEHCLSITVRDSAAFLAATERVDVQAPLEPVGLVSQSLNRKLHIGFHNSTLVGDQIDPVVQAALEHTISLCQDLGHEVVEIAPLELSGKAISDGFFTMAGSALDQISQIVNLPLDETMVEPFTLALLKWYHSLPDHALAQARVAIDHVKTKVLSSFEQYDVVLTPTIPIAPPKLGYLSPLLTREQVISHMEVIAGFTPIHNMVGLPAMSVPLFWDEDNLPMGSHFAASIGREDLLLQLAYQLEEACPWHDRRPTV